MSADGHEETPDPAATPGQQSSGRISRRQALGSAVAGAAGVALGPLASRAAAASPGRRHGRRPSGATVDVLVVGGGISGLTAAYRLLRHSNLSVRVLEANDRVGGRTVNLPLPGGKITEGGGQWTGPGQDRVQALARELKIGMFDTYVKGESVYVYRGNRQPHTGTLPPLGPAALADVVQNLTRLDQMASTVPLDAPWQAPNALQWDAMTFGQWLDANVANAEARSLYTLVFSIINGQDPHATSLLFALFVIHSGGGIARLIGTSGGAQNSRFVGGSQEISLRMARRLGSRVMLQTPVDHIDQTSKKHVVVRSGTQEFSARRVIVAMTPQDANRVHYAPTLTTQRIMVQKMWPIGGGWKTFAVYKEPFWRAQGLNGGAITDLPAALYTADNSPPDGSLGVLLSFFGTANQKFEFGGSPRQLNDVGARRSAVLEAFATIFGKQALHPIEYIEKDWMREPWIAGCKAPIPPGLLTMYTSALSDPVGLIHWAGTETAPINVGAMDGAVRAGERAAREVAAALGKNPSSIPA